MTRELDKLRQEAAHLRSQLQNHQALVAEKQNLQRQLDSLEVELENEKRSKQRAQDKETKSAVDELKLKVEEAEKRLNAEKREREKLVKQHEKTLSEVCGQNGRLEERISTLKEKIKGLNVELKEAKQNVDQHLPASIQAQSPEAKPRRRAATSRQEAAKKKDEEPSQQEASIFTPEQDGHAERRLAKKRGILNAPLGEKSNFSITPFLNRNKSLSEDLDSAQPVEAVSAPSEPDVDDDSEPEMEAHERPARPSTNTKENATTSTAAAPGITQPVSKKPRGRPKAKPLGETSPAKKNSTAPTVAKRRRQPAADQGVGQENTSPDAKGKTAQNIALSVSEASTKEPDGKKKRRKILGATNPSIFDEEDGEATTNIANLHMGPPGKRKRPNLGGPANAFAAASFSPLKRDRRGVGASFLG